MVLYTKDFVIGVCLGILFISMVATIITQQVYISRVTRLENVDKNVELLRQNVQFLLASTDESDHARLCSETGT